MTENKDNTPDNIVKIDFNNFIGIINKLNINNINVEIDKINKNYDNESNYIINIIDKIDASKKLAKTIQYDKEYIDLISKLVASVDIKNFLSSLGIYEKEYLDNVDFVPADKEFVLSILKTVRADYLVAFEHKCPVSGKTILDVCIVEFESQYHFKDNAKHLNYYSASYDRYNNPDVELNINFTIIYGPSVSSRPKKILDTPVIKFTPKRIYISDTKKVEFLNKTAVTLSSGEIISLMDLIRLFFLPKVTNDYSFRLF
ncbi:MAG: hypothetical protein LBS60_14495, partial [Deltaproteobacteria bacterium]|nr:hypothetical protein [Deltaproteobacteria bacterium]